MTAACMEVIMKIDIVSLMDQHSILKNTRVKCMGGL